MNNAGVIILLSSLLLLYLRLFVITKSVSTPFLSKQDFRFSKILLVSSAAGYLFYLVFFALSGWVWSFHKELPITEYTTIVREHIKEYDGIESFVLYGVVFACIVTALSGALLFTKLKMSKTISIVVSTVFTTIVGYYFYTLGFAPPMSDSDTTGILMPVVITIISTGLYFLYQRNAFVVKIIIVTIAAFAGLVSIGPPWLHDLSYIINPALRLKHGFKFSEIYFQYDIFLSLLALAWIKLKLALAWFAYLAQVSYFLLFLSLFFVANQLFKTKGLAVLFIIAVILIRLYSSTPNYPVFFQVTPIRLDLWVILFIIVHKKGAYHWSLGLAISLLVLLHRNLGIIYLVSYAQLILTLYIIDVVALVKKNAGRASMMVVTTNHLKLLWKNIVLIATSVALCFILFHELFSSGILTYRKIGLGMLPISRNSFYWFVPILLSCACSFLFIYKQKLGAKYTTTLLFIILLAIGNSLYFFGRSHENNILNISAVLVLVLFALFDMLIYLFPQRQFALTKSGAGAKAYIYLSLPFFCLFVTSYYYSEKIKANINTQYHNLKNKQVAYSLLPIPIGIPEIKKLTHNSPKVFFFDFEADVNYYFYGGYAPEGYYSPCASWVYKKDLIQFIQSKLDDGYYVVYKTQHAPFVNEYVDSLKYNQYEEGTVVVVIKKEKEKALLQGTASLIHSTMNTKGVKLTAPNINDTFTLEMIIKPTGQQQHDAMILNNITSESHLIKGITLQLNGDNQTGEYTFGIGNATSAIPRVNFHLENNKWSYLAILVDRKYIRVYNNGKQVASAATGGFAFVNSNTAINIGSLEDGSYKFSGTIREIRITNRNISDTEIINTGIRLDKQLNSTE